MERIRKNIILWRRLRIVVAMVCQIVALICVPISGDFREMYNVLYLFNDWEKYTLLKYTLECFTIFAKIFIPLTVYTPNFAFAATVGDVVNGMMIIRNRLQGIEKEFFRNSTKNHLYQRNVEKTLKMCIKKHIIILE